MHFPCTCCLHAGRQSRRCPTNAVLAMNTLELYILRCLILMSCPLLSACSPTAAARNSQLLYGSVHTGHASCCCRGVGQLQYRRRMAMWMAACCATWAAACCAAMPAPPPTTCAASGRATKAYPPGSGSAPNAPSAAAVGPHCPPRAQKLI